MHFFLYLNLSVLFKDLLGFAYLKMPSILYPAPVKEICTRLLDVRVTKSVLMRSTRRPHLLLVVSIDRYCVSQSLVMASLCLFPTRVRSVGLLMEFQLYSILFELLLLRFFLCMLKTLFLTLSFPFHVLAL